MNRASSDSATTRLISAASLRPLPAITPRPPSRFAPARRSWAIACKDHEELSFAFAREFSGCPCDFPRAKSGLQQPKGSYTRQPEYESIEPGINVRGGLSDAPARAE